MKLGFAFIFPWKETWTTTQFNVYSSQHCYKMTSGKDEIPVAAFTVHESLRKLSSQNICWKESERKKESEVTQLYPTVCDPVDCSLPGSSVHGILQARTLEWVTISFSRGSSWPRDWARVSHIGGWSLNLWATREAKINLIKFF